MTSPRRCQIARCHRCPLRILSRQSKVPLVSAVHIPASASRPPRPDPPRQPLRARLPTWRLAVSEAALPHPFLHRGCYKAGSAMFPVSMGGRWATTTGWGQGVREAVVWGWLGGADPKLSTLHPSLPQLLSMPSYPASPLGGLSVSTLSYSGFSWQPAGGRQEQLRGVGVERCRRRVGGVSTHSGARARESLL